jgi:hypothetical protein
MGGEWQNEPWRSMDVVVAQMPFLVLAFVWLSILHLLTLVVTLIPIDPRITHPIHERVGSLKEIRGATLALYDGTRIPTVYKSLQTGRFSLRLNANERARSRYCAAVPQR